MAKGDEGADDEVGLEATGASDEAEKARAVGVCMLPADGDVGADLDSCGRVTLDDPVGAGLDEAG